MAAQLTLDQVLSLVGVLDDAVGANTARDRFRAFLRESVTAVGTVRDYIDTCLRTSGPQYNRALQDLVNHAARLIGFDVQFGRYHGVSGEIGFDGTWHVGDLAIVVEVKTTDVYNIDTAILLGYVNRLISAGKIRDWKHALGLYVFGRSDSGMQHLADSIAGQNRSHELRITTTDGLLKIAELVQSGYFTTAEAVSLLSPAGVIVDDIVNLLARIAAAVTIDPTVAPTHDAPQQGGTALIAPPVTPLPETPETPRQVATTAMHLLTPVASDRENMAEDVIRRLLDKGWYVFGDRTAGRKEIKPGDRICFYVTGKGIVAEALVDSTAEKRTVPGVRNPERFPWAFRVKDVRYFFDRPVVLDAALRDRLDAFRGRDASGSWSWFVQGTHRITEADYRLLTTEQPS